jgi:hypothetical protein
MDNLTIMKKKKRKRTSQAIEAVWLQCQARKRAQRREDDRQFRHALFHLEQCTQLGAHFDIPQSPRE